MQKKPRRFRWVLTLLRYGLCLGAIVFLVTRVPWYDYVRLDDAEQTRVRLIEQRGDELIVLQGGREVTITRADVNRVEVGGQEVLDIEYGIPGVVRQTRMGLALLALLLFLPVPLLAAARLTWMLAIQKVRLSLWNSIKLTFAGNFFNFALPGTTGGDLIKAYYITRFTHRKTEAVTTVFLDRVVGLLSLVLMAGTMIIFTRDPSQFRDLGLPLAVIIGGLMIFGVVVFSRRVRRTLRLRDLVARLPLSGQLERIGNATIAMRGHKTYVLVSLLITFLLQGIVLVSAAVMAWALNMQGSFSYFFIYVAIGFLIAAVPSSPQAIGVMESAYVLFFTHGGQNTASQAVALAVSVRLLQLIWSLPGALVPLLGAHLPKRSELQELEQGEDDRPSDTDQRPRPSELSPAQSGQ